jgi:oligopeptide/dipeptide ABC transporter ATP-binding protein
MLHVRDLKTNFYLKNAVIPAVDGISFTVQDSEVLAVVGESGCGKSVTALSLLKLVMPPGRILGGRVLFEGQDLLAKSEEEIRKIRGNRIAMIFQDPMTSLNPVLTIGEQVIEVLTEHMGLTRRSAQKRATEMLALVGVPSPSERLRQYPHQLSGGLRQRVMIAVALSCNPKLLIADEPTTALDVTIQAQILLLLKKLQRQFGTSVFLITHDLGVVARMAQRVIVMYAGRIVEEATVREIFKNALHPYTRGLLYCLPRVDRKEPRLRVIPGTVPDLRTLPSGCLFYNRCNAATDACLQKMPEFADMSATHRVRCWRVKA